MNSRRMLVGIGGSLIALVLVFLVAALVSLEIEYGPPAPSRSDTYQLYGIAALFLVAASLIQPLGPWPRWQVILAIVVAIATVTLLPLMLLGVDVLGSIQKILS